MFNRIYHPLIIIFMALNFGFTALKAEGRVDYSQHEDIEHTRVHAAQPSLAQELKSVTQLEEKKEEKLTRVLSIDGGGIRGIVPLILLKAMEQRTGRRITDMFDVVTGTSTGSLIAAALAKENPLSIDQLIDIYKTKSSKIFKRSWKHRFKSFFGLAGPRYQEDGLESVLQEMVGNTKLSQLNKTFIAASYDIENGLPIIFNSKDAQMSGDFDFYLKDVLRASTAAPTYFRPKKIGDFTLVDGGLWANNPAKLGYNYAKQSNSNIMVVSLGTGNTTETLVRKQAMGAGIINWLKPVISNTMASASEWVDTELHNELRDVNGQQRYFRFQTLLDDVSKDLDNYSEKNLNRLIDHANKLIKTDPRFEKLCQMLKEA